MQALAGAGRDLPRSRDLGVDRIADGFEHRFDALEQPGDIRDARSALAGYSLEPDDLPRDVGCCCLNLPRKSLYLGSHHGKAESAGVPARAASMLAFSARRLVPPRNSTDDRDHPRDPLDRSSQFIHSNLDVGSQFLRVGDEGVRAFEVGFDRGAGVFQLARIVRQKGRCLERGGRHFRKLGTGRPNACHDVKRLVRLDAHLVGRLRDGAHGKADVELELVEQSIEEFSLAGNGGLDRGSAERSKAPRPICEKIAKKPKYVVLQNRIGTIMSRTS